MYIYIDKTIEQTKECAADITVLHKTYELTQLQHQLLALIYDTEVFSTPVWQEQLAKTRSFRAIESKQTEQARGAKPCERQH